MREKLEKLVADYRRSSPNRLDFDEIKNRMEDAAHSGREYITISTYKNGEMIPSDEMKSVANYLKKSFPDLEVFINYKSMAFTVDYIVIQWKKKKKFFFL